MTFLTGFPFTPGDSRVMTVRPGDGGYQPFHFRLVVRDRYRVTGRVRMAGVRNSCARYSAGLATNRPARCTFSIPDGQILAGGDQRSAIWRSTRRITQLLASRTDGTILQMDVGQ